MRRSVRPHFKEGTRLELDASGLRARPSSSCTIYIESLGEPRVTRSYVGPVRDAVVLGLGPGLHRVMASIGDSTYRETVEVDGVRPFVWTPRGP